MRMRPLRIVIHTFALISLMLVFAGCAQRKLSVNDGDMAGGTASATLKAVKVSGDASQVEISADKHLTYTFYKLADPPKAVIDLSQTEPGAVSSPIDVNAGNIKRIEVARHGFGDSVLSRVEITLGKDAEFSVTADPADKGKLVVAFVKPPAEKKVATAEKVEEKQLKVEDLSPDPAAVAEANPAPAAPAATEVKGGQEAAVPSGGAKAQVREINAGAVVESKAAAEPKGRVVTGVSAVPDGVEIRVTGGVDAFNAFRLTKPFRLVVDIPGAKSALGAKIIALDQFGIGKARLGISPDKVRVVFDAVQDTLPPYQVVKSENGIKVLFKGISPALPAKSAVEPVKEQLAKEPEPAKEPVKKPAKEPVAAAANEPAKDQTKEPAKELAKEQPDKEKIVAAVVEPTKQQTAEKAKSLQPKVSSVEAIDFKPADGFSRISIKVAGDCKADQPRKAAAGWVLTIRNCQLPRKLQRMLDTRAFASQVRDITPYQVKVKGGYDTKVLVKLRSEVPFDFRQEGDVIYWDIRNPAPPEAAAPPAEPLKAPAPPARPVARKEKSPAAVEQEPVYEKQQVIMAAADRKKVYTGRKVTLEFSDADIRKIFQLIAEVSNLNFLIADDVTGTISLKLVNVPWDQALDVILESKNLEKRQEGNIMYIKPKGRFKTQEQEEAEAKREREKRMELKTRIFDVNFAAIGDVASQFEKLKSERGAISLDARTNRVIVTDIEDRLEKMAALLKELDMPEKQVMIEARIVEASSSFTRDLGVQWGIHYRDGSASFLGINQLDTGFGGVVTPPPASGTAGPGGAIGMSFGKLTSNIQLDLRLSAAATAGLVKIVSTPKVVTLNNKSAKISQGQSVPYQTTSAEGTKTEFVEAALTLEVTPHITADGNIGMKIKATNNSIGDVPQGAASPSINKKEATTELQVMNGETTVIGGIYVDSDTENNTGVPFLMDIPLLGWLFKSNKKVKSKTELLIFITPRIVG